MTRKNTTGWCGLALAAAVAALVLAPASSARDTLARAKPAGHGRTMELRYTATFFEEDLTFGSLEGYDTVRLEGADLLTVPGKPMLPAQTVRLALPTGMAVTDVRVVYDDAVELAGQYLIFPAQPPQPVSGFAAPGELIPPDPAVYASSTPYPARLAEFTHQTDLAGQAMAVIRISPVDYIPAQRKLRFHRTVDVVIEGAAGYTCGDYLPPSLSEESREAYERMVTGMVVNPEDVLLQVGDGVRPLGRGVDPGDYDYVIITLSTWTDDFQPLADWKTRKGTPAAIVSTDWIYNSGGYSGSNQDKIRAFVQDAHYTWGAVYFLIGGDTNIVPYHTRYINGDDIPNDTYYGDYDSDWTCEVHVGRAPVRNTANVDTFIDKVLTYEQDPPLSNYAETALFLGFDLYTYGSDEGEGCKQDIYNYYLPSGWTYRREYDSESGSHKSDTIGYLNQGNNLVNHIDHCDTDVMGVGGTNHGDYLDNGDMDGLYNGDRQSILYTIGCWACDYPDYTCIAESFVRNSGGGGVAFVGNSRYGWYQPYSDDYVSLRYDRYFFRSLFSQGHEILGQCFSDHKNDAYQNDSYYQYIFTELTLLGDPEMPIWTEDPSALTVSHDPTVNLGVYTLFPVTVYDGGSPVNQAKVCLWKDGDIYAVAYTTSNGTVNIGIQADSLGTIDVTVTRHNYLPAESDVQVVAGSTDVIPSSYTKLRGRLIYGGLMQLCFSDDDPMILEPGITMSPTEPPVWLTVDATSPTASPGTLAFTLEACSYVAGFITQKIELYDYSAGAWELVDSRIVPSSDTAIVIEVSGDPSRFVQPGTLAMKAQLTWKVTGPIMSYPWQIGIDQVLWTIGP